MAQREWLVRDFYADLGVPSTATAEDIKRAYRKLARQLHPDARSGDPGSEERFKAVTEAHAVLSDPAKRREYDEVRHLSRMDEFAGGVRGGTGRHPGSDVFDLGDLFATGSPFTTGSGPNVMFGDLFARAAESSRTSSRPPRGNDVEIDTHLPLRQAVAGAVVALQVNEVTTCTACRGTGTRSGTRPRRCPTCHGAGTAPSTRSLSVRVPPGVRDGQRIRIPGAGSPGARAGPSGDLYVTVHVDPDLIFGRDGDDLTVTLPTRFSELTLGATVPVPTLEGTVTMKIPPGTPNGRTFRLRGHGVPRPGGGAGDLRITVAVAVPDHLDARAATALRSYARAEKASGFDPRRNQTGPR